MVVVQGLSENCADILCSLCEPEFWNGRHLCRRDFQGFSVTDVLILWCPALRMVIVLRVFAGASDVWPTEMRHLLTTSGITEFLEASIALVYGLIRQLGKHRILFAQISSLREALARVTGSLAHAPVFLSPALTGHISEFLPPQGANSSSFRPPHFPEWMCGPPVSGKGAMMALCCILSARSSDPDQCFHGGLCGYTNTSWSFTFHDQWFSAAR